MILFGHEVIKEDLSKYIINPYDLVDHRFPLIFFLFFELLDFHSFVSLFELLEMNFTGKALAVDHSAISSYLTIEDFLIQHIFVFSFHTTLTFKNA